MENLPIAVSMSRTSTGEFRLEVKDERSGIRMLEARLDAEQFANLMSSAIAHVSAEIPVDVLSRVGKAFEHDSLRPSDLGLDNSETRMSPKPTDEMNAAAVRAVTEQGYESYRWSKHNYGWSLQLSRWVKFDPEKHTDMEWCS